MRASIAIVLVVATSALGSLVNPGVLSRKNVNVKNLPNDRSWSLGKSLLVGVGDDPTPSACTSIFSCADCSTAQVCKPNGDGTFTQVKTIACPADRPHCLTATGTCADTPDPTCGADDTFICLDDGNFPDADCRTYHVCQDYTAHKFQCIVDGQNYNADTKTCETTSECASFGCDGSGKKVASSLYPSYFAYCDETLEAPVVIDRCVGINQLNETSQLCEPICHEEGVLQDTNDCTKYYKCSDLWINESTKYLTRERLDCPLNTGFDPSNFICVGLTELPSCQAEVQTKLYR